MGIKKGEMNFYVISYNFLLNIYKLIINLM